MDEPWTEIYRPTEIHDIAGNSDEVKSVYRYIQRYQPGMGPLLVHGPPGVGKNTAVEVSADTHGYHIFEINASDDRTADDLPSRLRNAAQSAGWADDNRLVFVDECDNIAAGAIDGVVEAIDEATNPIVFSCNFLHDVPDRIRDKCTEETFDYLDEDDVIDRLRDILKERDISYEMSALRLIAERSAGDMRAAVNILQSSVHTMHSSLSLSIPDGYCTQDDRTFVFGPRDIDPRAAREVLDSIFSTRDDPGPWVVRGDRGFDIVAAEYAIRNGITLELQLPKHESIYADDWHDVWKNRLDEVIHAADTVYCGMFASDEEIDWDEYAYWTTMDCHVAYGWVQDEIDVSVESIWSSDSLRCDKANLGVLAV